MTATLEPMGTGTVWPLAAGQQWTILHGHVLALLAGLPERSVHVVCSSPPYFGLRSYSTEPQVWGGDPSCSHSLEATCAPVLTGGTGPRSAKQVTNAGSQFGNAWAETEHGISGGGYSERSTLAGFTSPDTKGRAMDAQPKVIQSATCTRCGAWRGELGSEPVPDALCWARGEPPCAACFVCHIRTIWAALWRVLRDDGTCWLNLGDSMSGSGKGPTGHNGIGDQGKRQGFTDPGVYRGIPAKNCLMIPERVALALQADGWIVRSKITLCKVAPMPESVTDRPTNATEMLFLLSKRSTYFYDADAIRQPHADWERGAHGVRVPLVDERPEPGVRNRTLNEIDRHGNKRAYHPSGANLRNWLLATPEPTALAHYATFVGGSLIPRLATLAGTSAHGCCGRCQAGYRRVVVRQSMVVRRTDWGERAGNRTASSGTMLAPPTSQTTGWEPSCTCPQDLPLTSAIVCDPFSGSGTSGVVATRLGRRYIGLELSEAYVRMSEQRLSEDAPMMDAIHAASAPTQLRFEEPSMEPDGAAGRAGAG